MHLLYTLALLLAILVASPWWITAMLVSGKYRQGLNERLGLVPDRILHPPFEATVWIHAVSVGELVASSPLIHQLRSHLAKAHPGVRVVVSTTTRTGQQLAREKFGAENVFYFPLDFPWAIERYRKALRPRLLVLLETEFWPNCLHAAERHNIPLAVVNARISDRSYPRYLRLRLLWARFLRPLSIALAQSEVDAERLQRIGVAAGKIRVLGNLKFDSDPAHSPEAAVVETLRQHLPPGAPVWVCGSTAPGEEASILEAHAFALRTLPGLVTILAPRQPERFDAVAALLPEQSLRRSVWFKNPRPIAPGSLFLLDSIGELAPVYSLGTVAFVGGSLFAPGGGHNPIEAASRAVPIITGPFTQNFRGICKALHHAGAMVTSTPASLARDVTYLLQHPRQSADRGQRALQIVQDNRGATERTLQHLLQLLEPGTCEPPSQATEAEIAWANSGRSPLAPASVSPAQPPT